MDGDSSDQYIRAKNHMTPNLKLNLELAQKRATKKTAIKASIVILFSFCLSGCASTQQVSIPVPLQCPIPALPPKPRLPIADLTSASSPDIIAKAYVISVKLLIAHVDIIHQELQAQEAASSE